MNEKQGTQNEKQRCIYWKMTSIATIIATSRQILMMNSHCWRKLMLFQRKKYFRYFLPNLMELTIMIGNEYVYTVICRKMKLNYLFRNQCKMKQKNQNHRFQHRLLYWNMYIQIYLQKIKPPFPLMCLKIKVLQINVQMQCQHWKKVITIHRQRRRKRCQLLPLHVLVDYKNTMEKSITRNKVTINYSFQTRLPNLSHSMKMMNRNFRNNRPRTVAKKLQKKI
mmetsp:Transcript_9114/g.13793  ORF Transcript_9114/g.13793 Transcript_9114/m.13793 type:complete len:223 (+) Transcript_9114:1353-2021(+)